MEIKLCAFADEASPALNEQIEALVKHNIPYIELRGVNGKNVSEATPEEATEWKAQLDAAGIKVWAIGSPIGKVKLDKPWSEYLALAENIFRIATVLDCKNIRIFSFFTTDPADEETVLTRLSELCGLAASYGLRLCHENEKEIYGDVAPRCRRILDALPALSAVFDPANFVQCGEDIPAALELLRNDIFYYHIKDALAADGAVVPAGYGDGHIEEMLSGITHDTVLTLEPHLSLFKGYSSIDASELKHKFRYPDAATAFAAAADALKAILRKLNYTEENNTWKR